MTITFYNNASERNAVTKDLTEIATLSGALREESSIIDPKITIASLTNSIKDINYAYIPDFGRYYFINEIVSVRNGVWRISMHVDVLMTYAEGIRNNSAIIQRNENEYDLKLNDGLFVTQQNPRKSVHQFPAGFTDFDFVLAIAGQ